MMINELNKVETLNQYGKEPPLCGSISSLGVTVKTFSLVILISSYRKTLKKMVPVHH